MDRDKKYGAKLANIEIKSYLFPRKRDETAIMEGLKTLHNEAMDMAQMARMEEHKGNQEKAQTLFRQAFDKEREAALLAYTTQHPQPGLSILLQSAAHLGVTSHQNREAEKLIGLALSGDAPAEIRNDLRKLLASLETPTDGQYETYAIQIPSGDTEILNALSLMLSRLGYTMKKIAVL